MSRNASLITPLKLFGTMQTQLNQNKGSMVFSNTGNLVNKTGKFPVDDLSFEKPEPEKVPKKELETELEKEAGSPLKMK